jgi:BirA family biotin operon repressor/biotin-[acetyl-CoA-carboxylase] ligase
LSFSEGDWLIALDQQAGRGRQGRTWLSSPGNFYGSTLVELRDGDPPAQSLALVAGLALVEAIDAAIPGQPLMLKWPNDTMLLGSKLAGILLERNGARVAVGFGVNLASAPDLPDRKCASLSGEVSPQAFAPLIAASVARLLNLWRNSAPALIGQAWLARAHPLGTTVTAHTTGSEVISGRFDGLEPDGAMRLRREDGSVEIVRAADVQLG